MQSSASSGGVGAGVGVGGGKHTSGKGQSVCVQNPGVTEVPRPPVSSQTSGQASQLCMGPFVISGGGV